VLVHQIESGLIEREGRAVTNFSSTPQAVKDPYIFDFLLEQRFQDVRAVILYSYTHSGRP